jgi:hypothetical protein
MRRLTRWNPLMVLDREGDIPRKAKPNELLIFSADVYEERAVDLCNRGYEGEALVAAVLSLAARLDQDSNVPFE